MVHGVVGMCGIIQILIEIAPFDSKVFIKGPAEASKSAILIEAGLTARRRRINSHEELIPGDDTQARFKLQRVA